MEISTFLTYAPDKRREAIKMTKPEVDSVIFLKSFIQKEVVNSSLIKNEQKTFLNINPLFANHRLLLFANLIEISSRIFKLFVSKHNKTFKA